MPTRDAWYAIKCMRGEHRGMWLGRFNRAVRWRAVQRFDTQSIANDAKEKAQQLLGGVWHVVPVEEPDVKPTEASSWVI